MIKKWYFDLYVGFSIFDIILQEIEKHSMLFLYISSVFKGTINQFGNSVQFQNLLVIPFFTCLSIGDVTFS